jgi:hypothetical protein
MEELVGVASFNNDLASQISNTVEESIKEYADIIYNIANDIYDSCIQEYYASYTPKVYKRHGNPEGFNLYRANSFEFDGTILTDFNGGNPDALLKYGTRSDIRDEVLAAVISGQRGIKVRKSPPATNKWPMGWVTSYPNEYSKYNYWSSNANTIEDIINDFDANIIDDTSDLLEKIVNKHLSKNRR